MAAYRFNLGVFRAPDRVNGSRYSVRMYRPGADTGGLSLVQRCRNWTEANHESERLNALAALERG